MDRQTEPQSEPEGVQQESLAQNSLDKIVKQPGQLSSVANPETGDSLLVAYKIGHFIDQRPVFRDRQTYRQSNLPDNRPIFATQTDLLDWSSAPAGRPIAKSDVKSLENVALPYKRPLFTSEMKDWPTYTLSGDRPVAPIEQQFPIHPALPNDRPIASNEIDNPHELMGFID